MIHIRIRVTELSFDHVLNNTAFIGWRIYVLYSYQYLSDITDIFTCSRLLKIPWIRNTRVRLFRNCCNFSENPRFTSGVYVNSIMYPVASYIPQSIVLAGRPKRTKTEYFVGGILEPTKNK